MLRRLVPLLLAIALAGCGIAPQGLTTRPDAGLNALGHPQSKQEFVEALKRQGIRLSDDQLALIQVERQLEPKGIFADRPAHNLSAEENLQVHFKKHGHEFSPAIESQEAYLARAVALAKGERGELLFFFDTQSFQKGYQSHVVRWNPQSKEMTCLRPDGATTTFYRNFKLSSKRFVRVPVW